MTSSHGHYGAHIRPNDAQKPSVSAALRDARQLKHVFSSLQPAPLLHSRLLLLEWCDRKAESTLAIPNPANSLKGHSRCSIPQMMVSQPAVAHRSSKTKSLTSLKGKLLEGGVQFRLPFSGCPAGARVKGARLRWEESGRD